MFYVIQNYLYVSAVSGVKEDKSNLFLFYLMNMNELGVAHRIQTISYSFASK